MWERAADPELAQRHDAALVAAGAWPDDERVANRLVAVLGASQALGEHLVRFPDDITAIAAPPEAPRGGNVEQLRRAYRRSLIFIAADDLAGAADLERTTQALAHLADQTLDAAHRMAVAEHPGDAQLGIVAMGKAGGLELNYVSDVDVIFAADGDLDLATRRARRVIEIGGTVAWPVDAALRPEGKDGPLVRTLASHEAYYGRWAKTWEFQALIKARAAAGDLEKARGFVTLTSPLVWQAADRAGVVDEVRAMRRRIEEHLGSGARGEVKLGPGGLRDVEFAVQLLQLVHGRADDTIRSGTTLHALAALSAGGYVGRADAEALADSYRFLRQVEHRLQLQRLRRTHRVPEGDETAMRWLARAMGFVGSVRQSAADALRAELTRHTAQVRQLYDKLLYRPVLEAVARVRGDELRMPPEAAAQRLAALGFADPPGALRHVGVLTAGVSRAAAIQRTLLPAILGEFASAPAPDAGLLAYRRVSEQLRRTPWYLGLLRDSGPMALRLARLLALSRYVTELLARDPEAVRLLADDAELTPVDRVTLVSGMRAAAARHEAPTDAVAAIRAVRRRELFRIACADLLGLADLDAVGHALTDLTEACVDAALWVASGVDRSRPALGEPAPLAVFGMGRFGGAEQGYASDADVLFVGPSSAAGAAGALRELLSAPAPDPPLLVDADLRPEGREGALVLPPEAYQAYYAGRGEVWEAQALLRARFVAGDPALGEALGAVIDPVRYPADGLSARALVEIRRIKARVNNERLPRGADPLTHLKLGRGGLVDVEWAVQVLQLRHAGAHPALRVTSTLAALTAAVDAVVIDRSDAVELRAGWELASRARNALTLVRGRGVDQLPRQGPELVAVAQILGRDDPAAFLDEYLRTARRTHAAAERVLYS